MEIKALDFALQRFILLWEHNHSGTISLAFKHQFKSFWIVYALEGKTADYELKYFPSVWAES